MWCFPILNLKAYIQIREDVIVDTHSIFGPIILESNGIIKKLAIINSWKSKNPAKNINITFFKYPSLAFIFTLFLIIPIPKYLIIFFFEKN